MLGAQRTTLSDDLPVLPQVAAVRVRLARQVRSSAVAPTTARWGPSSASLTGPQSLDPEFYSLYSHEFVRVACCVPRTRVADADFNLGQTLRLAAEGDKARTAIMVFPELGLSSYAIEDLLLQDALLDAGRAVDRQGGRGVARRCSRSWSSARRCG